MAHRHGELCGLQGHYLGAENLEGFVTWEAGFGLFLEGLYNCNRQRGKVAYIKLIKPSGRCVLEIRTTGTGSMAQLAERLPSMHEALGLAPSAT